MNNSPQADYEWDGLRALTVHVKIRTDGICEPARKARLAGSFYG